MKVGHINFPEYTGVRCLMMPYIQGDPDSIPEEYSPYMPIVEEVFIDKGSVGYLTIDESSVKAGNPHRGYRAKHGRALHTEAGLDPDKIYCWGGAGWGKEHNVTLDRDVKVLLANSIDKSCALWDSTHENTTIDGDIGAFSLDYPYSSAEFMMAGEVHEIGILTPHESIPIEHNCNRQFLRIISGGVYGREPYFTENPVMRQIG